MTNAVLGACLEVNECTRQYTPVTHISTAPCIYVHREFVPEKLFEMLLHRPQEISWKAPHKRSGRRQLYRDQCTYDMKTCTNDLGQQITQSCCGNPTRPYPKMEWPSHEGFKDL